MLLRYRIVDRSKFLFALRRTLKYVLCLSAGFTVLCCYFFASTAFTRNKDGDYCDYYNEGLIYYARDDCYVNIIALVRQFFMFFFPLSVFFLLVFSVAGLGMFLLYLHYDGERLGIGKLTDGN